MKVIKKRRTFTERVARKIMKLAEKAQTSSRYTGIDYVDIEEFSNYIEIYFRTRDGSMSKWGTIRLKRQRSKKK